MTPQRRQRCRTPGTAVLVVSFLGGYCAGQAAAALRRARAVRRPPAEVRRVDGRRIVHSASDAILSIDEEAVIVFANPAAAHMFATSVANMRGSSLARFIQAPGRDTKLPLDYFPAGGGRAGRRATDYAVTGIRANGQLFPIEGSISSIEQDGRLIYTVILRDVSERHLVQQKLARSHDQLRQLSSALQTIREEERTHIARELHDDLGQLLASLRMDLTLLRQNNHLPDASGRLLDGMESNLLTAITSLRRIATNLRPRALDEGGLYFALQGLRDEFVERHGIACVLLAEEAELRLDDAASTAIFRIVQEALTNIARHAEATSVVLNLDRSDGELLVTIRDDGRGIRSEDMEKVASLGLIGMRERVWALHGEIAISADEPPGTRIDIAIPVSDHSHVEAPAS
ncbi:PAS domain-containing sensor histidine kinase [Massilia agri]|uniref:PAS domain-containing sensor histidine kinase n=1 Tax=Massilia agri TaxID=1886785 RepID=A0ABT2AMI1_9BURK|nr:PAS domain-containing sensor histidine kinase [Massilia agri]MCS0597457.1 PAS domain-containing sensor histidine kinase [Massilia agri]